MKRRIVSFGGGTKAALIYSYDKQGRLTDYGLTDNETGKRFQLKILYNYDSTGKINTDVEIDEDSSYNKHSIYNYNTSGQLVSKYTFDNAETLVEKDTVTYDPLNETETFFHADTIYRQQTAVYEDGYIFAYTRFYGYEYEDGKKETWKYEFKNYLDMKKRIVQRDNSLTKPSLIVEYSYAKNGLLIKRTERFTNPKIKQSRIQLISYEYW
ncbi:hypothetical protein [Niastella vici]|uniref:hypothetical protein n=1 Tax=Niastella vici TaxID=1703345 RepID=UPI0011811970|nr:hypothetical protein [Niastella vici]